MLKYCHYTHNESISCPRASRKKLFSTFSAAPVNSHTLRRVTLNNTSDYRTNGLYRTPITLTLTLTVTLVR